VTGKEERNFDAWEDRGDASQSFGLMQKDRMPYEIATSGN
jgi:hypothetical protein